MVLGDAFTGHQGFDAAATGVAEHDDVLHLQRLDRELDRGTYPRRLGIVAIRRNQVRHVRTTKRSPGSAPVSIGGSTRESQQEITSAPRGCWPCLSRENRPRRRGSTSPGSARSRL